MEVLYPWLARDTDVVDAVWLSDLLAHGLTRGAGVRDRRSIALGQTPFGERTLADDPILAPAADLAAADPGGLATLAAGLRGRSTPGTAANGGRGFGACHACRHFRPGEGEGGMPHRCALLDEPLSDADSRAIRVEQEPAVA